MSDEVNVIDELDNQVSDDLKKAAAEADLIDAGTYRFQVESYEGSKDEKEYFDEEQLNRNPWFGKTRYNLRLSLTSKKDGKGADAGYVLLDRPRTLFQRVSAAQVVSANGQLSTESKLFGQMAVIASKGLGKSATIRETLDYFSQNAAAVSITKSEATEKYPDPKNWVRKIATL